MKTANLVEELKVYEEKRRKCHVKDIDSSCTYRKSPRAVPTKAVLNSLKELPLSVILILLDIIESVLFPSL